MEQSERIGLGLAVTGHVALFAVLSLSIASRPEMRVPREPIAVTLADTVGLVSASPKPQAEAATAAAPERADELTEEQQAARPSEAKPAPQPEPRPANRPALSPARSSPPPPAQPQPRAERTREAASETRAARAPRLGRDFLKGVTDRASTSRSDSAPASTAGPAVQASLANEIRRQVKPHWQAPSGADVESLLTVLEVRLEADGSLAGEPRVVRQSGVSDSNRVQARLHIEQAIRAVKLAAPFRLPPEYYASWKSFTLNFDKRLSS